MGLRASCRRHEGRGRAKPVRSPSPPTSPLAPKKPATPASGTLQPGTGSVPPHTTKGLVPRSAGRHSASRSTYAPAIFPIPYRTMPMSAATTRAGSPSVSTKEEQSHQVQGRVCRRVLQPCQPTPGGGTRSSASRGSYPRQHLHKCRRIEPVVPGRMLSRTAPTELMQARLEQRRAWRATPFGLQRGQCNK